MSFCLHNVIKFRCMFLINGFQRASISIHFHAKYKDMQSKHVFLKALQEIKASNPSRARVISIGTVVHFRVVNFTAGFPH